MLLLTDPPNKTPAFDREDLLARCVGNPEFANRVLQKFAAHFSQQVEQLEERLGQGEMEEAARIAHGMRGAAASVAAPALRERVAQIERLARQDLRDQIPEQLARLQEEWSQFRDAALHGG